MQFQIEKDPNPKTQTKTAAKEEPRPDVRQIAEKIGRYGRFDPTNPKDRAIHCRICGKFNSRRTYCNTHSPDDIRSLIEKVAVGEDKP